jgi:hypothetical protein
MKMFMLTIGTWTCVYTPLSLHITMTLGLKKRFPYDCTAPRFTFGMNHHREQEDREQINQFPLAGLPAQYASSFMLPDI